MSSRLTFASTAALLLTLASAPQQTASAAESGGQSRYVVTVSGMT